MEYLEDNLDDWLADELEVRGAMLRLPGARARCPARVCRALRWSAAQAYGDEDYLIFDCPGQIELYSHASVFRTLSDWLKNQAGPRRPVAPQGPRSHASCQTRACAQGWNVAAVYCLDAQFASDAAKYIAGMLQALSAMVQLELPHINVLTKVDLLSAESKVGGACLHSLPQRPPRAGALTGAPAQKVLEELMYPEARYLAEQLQSSTGAAPRQTAAR